MEHDVFLRFEALDFKLAQILVAVTQTETHMSAEFDNLTAEVHQNTDVTQSAIVAFNGLAQQLRDAANDPIKINALAAELDANSNALAAAVAANTPAAPAPNP